MRREARVDALSANVEGTTTGGRCALDGDIASPGTALSVTSASAFEAATNRDSSAASKYTNPNTQNQNHRHTWAHTGHVNTSYIFHEFCCPKLVHIKPEIVHIKPGNFCMMLETVMRNIPTF